MAPPSLRAAFSASVAARPTGRCRGGRLPFQLGDLAPQPGDPLREVLVHRVARPAGQLQALLGRPQGLGEVARLMLEIHGQLAEAEELVHRPQVLPQRQGLVPIRVLLEVQRQLALDDRLDAALEPAEDGLLEQDDRRLDVPGRLEQPPDADQVQGVEILAGGLFPASLFSPRLGLPPATPQQPGAPDDQPQQGQNVLLVVVEDGLDLAEVAGPQVVEVAVRDLLAGDVLGAVGRHHLAGQVEQAAGLVLVAPEMAGREEEVEVRQAAQPEALALEDEAGLQQGQVENLAVVGDHRAEAALLEEPGQLLEHPLLLARLAQEVLGHDEGAVAVVSEPDQERDGAGAPGQPGCLQVEEKSCIQA